MVDCSISSISPRLGRDVPRLLRDFLERVSPFRTSARAASPLRACQLAKDAALREARSRATASVVVRASAGSARLHRGAAVRSARGRLRSVARPGQGRRGASRLVGCGKVGQRRGDQSPSLGLAPSNSNSPRAATRRIRPGSSAAAPCRSASPSRQLALRRPIACKRPRSRLPCPCSLRAHTPRVAQRGQARDESGPNRFFRFQNSSLRRSCLYDTPTISFPLPTHYPSPGGGELSTDFIHISPINPLIFSAPNKFYTSMLPFHILLLFFPLSLPDSPTSSKFTSNQINLHLPISHLLPSEPPILTPPLTYLTPHQTLPLPS
ncbi:hypothetical protein J2S32_003157 [Qipengyuania citrea]|nr:hypothetical protein [Qipengyuania citrea]